MRWDVSDIALMLAVPDPISFSLAFFKNLLYTKSVCTLERTGMRPATDGAFCGAGWNMNCKEFEKRIPDFIEERMDFLTLEEFGEHMESCAECREELVISFLVSEGMQRLENGEAFDLNGELDKRVAAAQKKVHFHNRFLKIGAVCEVLTVLGVLGFLGWIL